MEKELQEERVAKSLLEAKLGSEGGGASESEEVARLNEELKRLQSRFGEALQLEEKRRVETSEQIKVRRMRPSDLV